MEKIIEKLDGLGAHLTFIFIVVMASMSRTILTEEHRTIGGYIRAIIVAGFVGSLATYALKDYDLGEGLEGVIVGVSAFIANDILHALLIIGSGLAKDPVGTIRKLRGLK